MENTTLDKKYYTLQSMLWPERGISTEHLLYLRLSGAAAYSDSNNSIAFSAGGVAEFNTSANLFNLGKWRRHCRLNDLGLRLEGKGRFELVIFQVLDQRSWERPINDVIELKPNQISHIDLTDFLDAAPIGLLYFSLRALEDGVLKNAAWETLQPPLRQPQLALSITTFKRETAVEASVNRFKEFMTKTPLAPYLHLIVVDNGRSARIDPSQHVTLIGNENFGGSGGFARGLLEAIERDASHCLFMDDDASVHMGVLERTWTFLAYAINPKTAVAGGMTMAKHRWALWENGAIFDRHCQPQWHGLDLRHPEQIMHMEMRSTQEDRHNFYGGWWYFAFPIHQTNYHPFPFFVRGDDVSFSIANAFNIVTLPGVVCFQDADFSDKETAQTLYLDLRSHIVHHLTLPQLDIGMLQTMSIPREFFLRSLFQCHYESMSALNLALSDVMQGPEFFAKNADMAARRASIAALRKNEDWKPIRGPLPHPHIRFHPDKPFTKALMKYTLNGHLLPYFGLYGNKVILEAGQRGQTHPTCGAAQITYISADGTQSYTVQHSKLEALRQGGRMLKNGFRFMRRYSKIKKEWQHGYRNLANNDFWTKQLAASKSFLAAE